VVDGGSGATEPVGQPAALFSIVRVAIRRDGAFGVLLFSGYPFAVSLERTYDVVGDRHFVKIPPGRYRCVATWYNTGRYRTFEILVPGHSRILFHKGNISSDADGCVLVAESYAVFSGMPGIGDSAGGFREFMAKADSRQGFDLEVKEAA